MMKMFWPFFYNLLDYKVFLILTDGKATHALTIFTTKDMSDNFGILVVTVSVS